MTKFTTDNTEGYTGAELAELNRRLAAKVSEIEATAGALDPIEDKSTLDYLAERVLAEFDAEQAAA